MPVHPVLSRAEWEALHEHLRHHYTPKGDAFVLNLGDEHEVIPVAERVAQTAKLAEFEANNRTMRAECERLRALKEKFQGVDPEEYRRLKAVVPMIERAVAEATAPLLTQLAEAEHVAAEARRQAARGQFREHVRTVAIRARVRSEALGYVAHEAEEVFGYHPDTGAFLPKTGHYNPWDPLRDLTVETWLRQLAETDPGLFEPRRGRL